MASQGPKNPSTGSFSVNFLDPFATMNWNEKAVNLLASDNSYNTVSWTGVNTARDYSLSITGGVNNLADFVTDYPTTDTYADHGSPTDLWGAVLFPSTVNSSSFLCRYAPQQNSVLDGSVVATTVNFIDCSNWGFTIPTLSVIKGVVVGIERKSVYAARTNTTTMSVDHMRMTVYYQPNFYPKVRMYMLAPLIVKVAGMSLVSGILKFFNIHKVEHEDGKLLVTRSQTRYPRFASMKPKKIMLT